jgi:predicted nucleic acid-binding protein
LTRSIVVDASVVVDLLGRFEPEPLDKLLLGGSVALAAPELLTIEVLQALRRLERAGAMTSPSSAPIMNLRALPIAYYPHESLVAPVWSLRHDLTAYDATYVALARELDAPLVTRDRKLAAAPLQGVEVLAR